MIRTAKLFTNGGSQAIRLPKEFRFTGKEVRIRRTKNGISITPNDDGKEQLHATMRRLAGSCPDFPDIPKHTAPDLPRGLNG